MAKISLSEMVLSLRSELQKAQYQAEGQDLRFRVEDIEIELELAATQEGEAGGKVDFWVYSADLKGKMTDAITQRLKLRLKPLTPEGDLQVSRRDTK